jgi:hypothetical protein
MVRDLSDPTDEDLFNDHDPKAVEFNKLFLATPEEQKEFETLLVGNPRGDFLFILNILKDVIRA